ncbi:hypothetical protein SAMN05720468_11818 [Fibrobacter sp. UWEL]|nr:hypothetical protein SAMN05720468_11818 [Fibrobacter sp. UWEL]
MRMFQLLKDSDPSRSNGTEIVVSMNKPEGDSPFRGIETLGCRGEGTSGNRGIETSGRFQVTVFSRLFKTESAEKCLEVLERACSDGNTVSLDYNDVASLAGMYGHMVYERLVFRDTSSGPQVDCSDAQVCRGSSSHLSGSYAPAGRAAGDEHRVSRTSGDGALVSRARQDVDGWLQQLPRVESCIIVVEHGGDLLLRQFSEIMDRINEVICPDDFDTAENIICMDLKGDVPPGTQQVHLWYVEKEDV